MKVIICESHPPDTVAILDPLVQLEFGGFREKVRPHRNGQSSKTTHKIVI
jgi:hypothetical protein